MRSWSRRQRLGVTLTVRDRINGMWNTLVVVGLWPMIGGKGCSKGPLGAMAGQPETAWWAGDIAFSRLQ